MLRWCNKYWRNVVDARLLDILVCPLCKSGLEYDKAAQELICHADKLAYPIRDGIPIMWADQARSLLATADTPPPGAAPGVSQLNAAASEVAASDAAAPGAAAP
jgi:uncharacterized protein YbaR (Trm112 family)